MKKTQRTPLSSSEVADRALAARMRNSALRSADDPAKLALALRVVRAALATGKVAPTDLRGPIVQTRRAVH